MAQLVDENVARDTLSALAEQRRVHLQAQSMLHDNIRFAVRAAQAAGIPMTEIARLLEMDRSSVYRTYVEAA